MGEIRLYKSVWKSLRLLLACLPFVILSAWALWLNPKLLPHAFALYLLMGSGLLALVFLMNAADRRPQIIINETGMFDRTAYADFINWDAIDHSYWKIAFGQRFICLIIKDEFKPQIKGQNKIKQISLRAGLQEINIRLNYMSNVDIEKLNALIVMLKDATPLKRDKLIVNGNTFRS